MVEQKSFINKGIVLKKNITDDILKAKEVFASSKHVILKEIKDVVFETMVQVLVFNHYRTSSDKTKSYEDPIEVFVIISLDSEKETIKDIIFCISKILLTTPYDLETKEIDNFYAYEKKIVKR